MTDWTDVMTCSNCGHQRRDVYGKTKPLCHPCAAHQAHAMLWEALRPPMTADQP